MSGSQQMGKCYEKGGRLQSCCSWLIQAYPKVALSKVSFNSYYAINVVRGDCVANRVTRV